MKGYSKIKVFGSSKSRSMDLNELPTFPVEQDNMSNTTKIEQKNPKSGIDDEKKPVQDSSYANLGENQEDISTIGDDPKFCTNKLKRNSSISSTTSAVKSLFSMKRSSSVSERYCRIHDQSSVTFISSPDDDDEGEDGRVVDPIRQMRKISRGKALINACKKLFGVL